MNHSILYLFKRNKLAANFFINILIMNILNMDIAFKTIDTLTIFNK